MAYGALYHPEPAPSLSNKQTRCGIFFPFGGVTRLRAGRRRRSAVRGTFFFGRDCHSIIFSDISSYYPAWRRVHSAKKIRRGCRYGWRNLLTFSLFSSGSPHKYNHDSSNISAKWRTQDAHKDNSDGRDMAGKARRMAGGRAWQDGLLRAGAPPPRAYGGAGRK